MKTWIFLALSLLVAMPLANAQQAESPTVQAEKLYRSGLQAVRDGDVATARMAFERALSLNPGHANARFQMLQLRDNKDRVAARARELRLTKVMLPKVDFDDVTLEEVVDALDVLIRKETKDEFAPNFIIQDSSGALAQVKVNVQLRNVPANVVLKYVLDQAKALVHYDQHAILIRPATAPAKAPAPAE